ncbi:DUF805 domain-containing protein [Rhodobacterales bacterium HKCCE3408]|nr:DUF805 domain-containing protein [Rhodobacterales bacterium HKCCE3408]
MNMIDAVKVCFSKYVDFSGRARRSEYWWWVLFVFIVSFILGFIPIVGSIVSLVFLLPGLAVTARRLHDIDRSGWFMLLPYAPLILAGVTAGMSGGEPGTFTIVLGVIGLALMILLLVWLIKKGTDGPNRFGPDPLA